MNISSNFQKGNILYQQISKKYLEECLSVLKDSFFRDETVCKVMGVSKCEDSIFELLALVEEAAQDGISLMAFDQKNQKVAGVVFNKIQVFSSFNCNREGILARCVSGCFTLKRY